MKKSFRGRYTEKSRSGQAPLEIIWQYINPILKYAATTLGISLYWLQSLIGLLLAVSIVSLAVWFGAGYAKHMVLISIQGLGSAVTAGICETPMLNLLPFCPSHRSSISGSPEFDQLMKVQGNFDQVLESSAVYASLPMDLKRTELSIRDLKHVVSYSNLPSRQELTQEFENFVETARQAGWDLTQFNSAIGRTMDHILSTNRWTLQVIDGVAEREAGRGAIGRFMDGIPPAFGWPTRSLDEILLEQYLKHTSQVEEQITRLVLEAQALLGLLAHLDDELDIIAGVVTRDGIAITNDRDELFSYLWTKLGGNRSSVKKLEEQLQLLKDVNSYRRTAWAHVNGALLKLQEIQADLMHLKERVAAPETIGLDIPLAQHIDIIRRGAERLEEARRTQKTAEGAKIRKFIDSQRGDDSVRTVQGNLVQGISSR